MYLTINFNKIKYVLPSVCLCVLVALIKPHTTEIYRAVHSEDGRM
jgi:hypothetical protein